MIRPKITFWVYKRIPFIEFRSDLSWTLYFIIYGRGHYLFRGGGGIGITADPGENSYDPPLNDLLETGKNSYDLPPK